MRNPWLFKTTRVIGLVFSTISIIVIIFNVGRSIFSPDQEKVLDKLKNEVKKIEKLANSSVVSEDYTAVLDKTSINFTYFTKSSDKEIQEYYDDELKRNGWILVEHHKVYDWGRDLGGKIFTYNKFDLYVKMQYSGDRNGYGWACSFSITPNNY